MFLKEALERGAKYAVVNPIRIKSAERADFVLSPRPGTDAALALAVMHVIVAEGLQDDDFIERHTLGFEDLAGVLARFSPQRGEEITGVPGAEIRRFAEALATTHPAFIYVGPGCQRHTNAGMTLRTLACLPAVTGAWRHRPGGIYFPTSTGFPGDFESLEGNDLRPNAPAGYNMIHLGRMLEGDAIQSLFVMNGNPASVLYDQNRLRRGLMRDDLFTVVHERFLTDTARHADIVLPATSAFEQNDIFFSYYHPSLLLSRQAVEPFGQSRANLDLLSALAKALRFDDPEFDQDEETVIEQVLALDQPAITGIDREALRDDGWAPAGQDPVHDAFAGHRYPTPSGRIEFHSERAAAAGLGPLPDYHPPRESPDGNPDLFHRYPLQFLTPSAHSIHNTSFGDGPGFRGDENTPILLLNPADAGPRAIAEGDLVRVHNGRGACLLRARVSDAIRQGVIMAAGQWWDRRYVGGSTPNHTTPDYAADLGGGSAFNSNLVEVELAANGPPQDSGRGGRAMTAEHSPAEGLIHRGIGHVEFFDLTPETLTTLDQLITAMAREGRRQFSFHAPISRSPDYPKSGVTCYFLCEEAEKRAYSLALLDETLAAAAHWGATHVVTHLTYGPSDTHDHGHAVELAAAAAAEMAAMSRRHGVPIDIEFAAYTDAFHEPGDFLATIAPHPKLGICVDVGHAALGAMIRARDVIADVAHLAPKARSLHLWNTLGLEHTKNHHHTPLHPDQAPEDGWLDIPLLLATVLKAAPYAQVVFEYPVEDVDPEIEAGYAWIESLVTALRIARPLKTAGAE